MDARISLDARQRIVHRQGGTTLLTAAALRDGNELAYAIRVLADHFTYKRSKGQGSVNVSAAKEAEEAMATALNGFKAEVMGQKMKPALPPVSPLAEGIIGNPYDYVN